MHYIEEVYNIDENIANEKKMKRHLAQELFFLSLFQFGIYARYAAVYAMKLYTVERV